MVASFLSDSDSDSDSDSLGVSQLLAGTITNDRGTTTLGATLDLAIPGGTVPGSYNSTITITLVAG